jgi:short-subunit dehydrogenase
MFRSCNLQPVDVRMTRGIRQLNRKVAVVTGAASGIGRALAQGLSCKGCHLSLVDINAPGLQTLQKELAESHPDRVVTTHVADVSDPNRMQEVAREVASAHGAVHVLINNAGITYESPFPQTSLEDWERIIGVNVRGVIHGCHFFLPYLAKADRGHIVNLSSLFGFIAMSGQTAYCTTKFAVSGFSEALREELRPTSIGVTVVYPGAVATNMIKNAKSHDPDLLQRVSRWYEQHAMSPDRAASRIIGAIERGSPRLVITLEAACADWIKRLLPVAANRILSDAVVRQMGLGDMREKRAALWQESMVKDVLAGPRDND